MNDGITRLSLPRLSDEYTVRDLNRVLAMLEQHMDFLVSKGRIQGHNLTTRYLTLDADSVLNVGTLPTSATGLSSGDVWLDTGTNNVKFVP